MSLTSNHPSHLSSYRRRGLNPQPGLVLPDTCPPRFHLSNPPTHTPTHTQYKPPPPPLTQRLSPTMYTGNIKHSPMICLSFSVFWRRIYSEILICWCEINGTSEIFLVEFSLPGIIPNNTTIRIKSPKAVSIRSISYLIDLAEPEKWRACFNLNKTH